MSAQWKQADQLGERHYRCECLRRVREQREGPGCRALHRVARGWPSMKKRSDCSAKDWREVERLLRGQLPLDKGERLTRGRVQETSPKRASRQPVV